MIKGCGASRLTAGSLLPNAARESLRRGLLRGFFGARRLSVAAAGLLARAGRAPRGCAPAGVLLLGRRPRPLF